MDCFDGRGENYLEEKQLREALSSTTDYPERVTDSSLQRDIWDEGADIPGRAAIRDQTGEFAANITLCRTECVENLHQSPLLRSPKTGSRPPSERRDHVLRDP